MSIDKSLKRKGGMARTRCVMTRAERIAKMMENGAFPDGRSPFGLPKTRVQKVVLKKKAKKEATEGEAAAGAPGAAPGAAATPAAGAAAKPAAGGAKK
jgi:small basic protein (TIGR04137 family)